jgi:hypothetical protein
LILARIGVKGRRDYRLTIKKELIMSLRKSAIAALAAVSMVAMPTAVYAAQAQSSAASKLSVRAAPAVKSVRAGATTRDQSNLGGGSVIIAILAAVAVIVGIVIAADGSNSPTSP